MRPGVVQVIALAIAVTAGCNAAVLFHIIKRQDALAGQLQGIAAATDGLARQTGQIGTDAAWIRSELAKRNPMVPTVHGLGWETVGGKKVKVLQGPLRMDVDVLAPLSLRRARTPIANHDVPPVPWPERYTVNHKQEFNPYTFALNCSLIADQIAIKNGDWSKPIAYLLEQLKTYTNAEGLVFYDFEWPQKTGVLKPGWTSALANGSVIIGLLQLYEATRDRAYLDLARSYLNALNWNGENTDILVLDDANYLWFEEYPVLGGLPTGVHNGHALVVLALYRYQQLTGDTSFETLLRAGLATAARYLPEARRPGGIPNYWMFDEVPDYGPLRLHNLTLAFAEITGNRTFLDLADAFKTDIPLR